MQIRLNHTSMDSLSTLWERITPLAKKIVRERERKPLANVAGFENRMKIDDAMMRKLTPAIVID
jgi:hypothetical protein